MVGLSLSALILFATSLARLAYAAHAMPAFSTSTSQYTGPTKDPNCPYPVKVDNGGFESGKLSPWATDSGASFPHRIVSPGNNKSKYALRVDSPAGNGSYFSISQITNGRLCYGFLYNISYSWNWIKYTGPEGPGVDDTNSCVFGVHTGYADHVSNTGKALRNPEHYGTRKPGWHHHSYMVQAEYMECYNNVPTAFLATVECNGYNFSKPLPASTILIDNLKIERLLRPATTPPGDFGCPPLR